MENQISNSIRKPWSRGAARNPRIQDRYQITGFISSGTYGLVFRAREAKASVQETKHSKEYAIKKFKPEKEGEPGFTGISQSATREIALCAELKHPNIIPFIETLLQDKSIYMIFEYCEHDLLQIIQHHLNPTVRRPLPAMTVRSIMYQLLQGCSYLHNNWILHRDLKPANIMVTSSGQIKIGDLGLARIFRDPLKPFYDLDKVVVTIWYRAPELLLGAKHYTPAIDMWSIGCIFGELLSQRPMFKGDEAKIDNRKTMPFQKNQIQKIHDILGPPNTKQWPMLECHPDYVQLQQFLSGLMYPDSSSFRNWYDAHLRKSGYLQEKESPGDKGFALLSDLLRYDPYKRLGAAEAICHPYFADMRAEEQHNCFFNAEIHYPKRKIGQDDGSLSALGNKRSFTTLAKLSRGARSHIDREDNSESKRPRTNNNALHIDTPALLAHSFDLNYKSNRSNIRRPHGHLSILEKRFMRRSKGEFRNTVDLVQPYGRGQEIEFKNPAWLSYNHELEVEQARIRLWQEKRKQGRESYWKFPSLADEDEWFYWGNDKAPERELKEVEGYGGMRTCCPERSSKFIDPNEEVTMTAPDAYSNAPFARDSGFGSKVLGELPENQEARASRFSDCSTAFEQSGAWKNAQGIPSHGHVQFIGCATGTGPPDEPPSREGDGEEEPRNNESNDAPTNPEGQARDRDDAPPPSSIFGGDDARPRQSTSGGEHIPARPYIFGRENTPIRFPSFGENDAPLRSSFLGKGKDPVRRVDFGEAPAPPSRPRSIASIDRETERLNLQRLRHSQFLHDDEGYADEETPQTPSVTPSTSPRRRSEYSTRRIETEDRPLRRPLKADALPEEPYRAPFNFSAMRSAIGNRPPSPIHSNSDAQGNRLPSFNVKEPSPPPKHNPGDAHAEPLQDKEMLYPEWMTRCSSSVSSLRSGGSSRRISFEGSRPPSRRTSFDEAGIRGGQLHRRHSLEPLGTLDDLVDATDDEDDYDVRSLSTSLRYRSRVLDRRPSQHELQEEYGMQHARHMSRLSLAGPQRAGEPSDGLVHMYREGPSGQEPLFPFSTVDGAQTDAASVWSAPPMPPPEEDVVKNMNKMDRGKARMAVWRRHMGRFLRFGRGRLRERRSRKGKERANRDDERPGDDSDSGLGM